MDVKERIIESTYKHASYFVLLWVFYILQTTPGFLEYNGIKPIFIIPIVVAIAGYEGEFVGASYGLAAGVLWDLSAGRTIGFFGMPLTIICFAVGILVKLYLRATVINFTTLSVIAIFMVVNQDFVFTYLLRNSTGVWAYYFKIVIPVILYSAVFSILLVVITKKLFVNQNKRKENKYQ